MEKIAIITDSAADIPQKYIDKYEIFVLPILILHQDKEFKDGIDITAKDIYELQKTETLKTASPSGGDILNLFEQLHSDGYTHAIAILLASGLSGTYNQVKLFAEAFDDIDVEVFDSCSGSIGYGATAIALAEYRNSGMSFDELKSCTARLIHDTSAFFSLDTLEYLKRGGRIGRATAFAGAVMNIKPILTFDTDTGEIDVAAKVRGRRKAMAKLNEQIAGLIEKNPERPFILMIVDGAAASSHRELDETFRTEYPQMKGCIHAKIGAALSIHLGPGLLGAGIQFI